jgi:hypothetical protein
MTWWTIRRRVFEIAAYSALGLLVGGLIRIGAGVP